MESTESTATIIRNVAQLNETKTIKTTDKAAYTLPVRPHIYPAIWPPYVFFRTSPYHHYQPSVRSNLYQPDSTWDEEAMMARNPFPVDDELSHEEALKELEAIKKEMAEDAAAKKHEERLILPSISVNPEESSVTVSLKSFAAFLRSFSSRVTVTLATRTILVPNVSLKN